MSPLTLSLPDMNSICPDCLPDSMSSQSWDAMFRVRLGFVAGPGFTVHAPSLMTACQVPPPSPLTSYWMVAFVPAALSARNRLPITSNVSFTVAMMFLLILVVRALHAWSYGPRNGLPDPQRESTLSPCP